MADYLAVAEWKKNVNSLLGLIHKKTGMTEALTKYGAVRKNAKTKPHDKVAIVDELLKTIGKTADAHKKNKKAQDYLKNMESQAMKERKEADDVVKLFDKGVGFKELLGNPSLWPFFMDFLKAGYTHADFEYWIIMKKDPNYEKAVGLVSKYINPKADLGLNLKGGDVVYKTALGIVNDTNMKNDEKLKKLLPILKQAVNSAEINMTEPWTRFIVSDDYVRLVAKSKGFKSWV